MMMKYILCFSGIGEHYPHLIRTFTFLSKYETPHSGSDHYSLQLQGEVVADGWCRRQDVAVCDDDESMGWM